MEGIDLVPALSGKSPIVRRELFWRRKRPSPQRAVRSGNWKLFQEGVNYYLFDVAADPGERHDLTALHEDLVRQLSARMDAWEKDVDSPNPEIAQGPAPAPATGPRPEGVWRGTSLCTVRPSACNNEVVVYYITRVGGSDSLSIDARRIVNGQEDPMGILGCRLAASGTEITCTMKNGVWSFSIRGDSIVGELRMPDNTKYRDVRLTRAR